MSSIHGWILLFLATAGAQHPHTPTPRVRPAPAVKSVALRPEAKARPAPPLRAQENPLGLPAGLRF